MESSLRHGLLLKFFDHSLLSTSVVGGIGSLCVFVCFRAAKRRRLELHV